MVAELPAILDRPMAPAVLMFAGSPLETPLNRRIEELEGALLKEPQRECPLVHRFSDGVYVREVTMPPGTIVIGHCHKTRHFNVVLTGRATVMLDGEIKEIVAPAIFESEPGVRKVLAIHEEMKWATIHVTPERDLEKLAELLIEKSETFLAHELRDKEKLKAHIESLQP